MIHSYSFITVREALVSAEFKLKEFSPVARLEAEILLAHILKTSKEELYKAPEDSIKTIIITRLNSLIEKRKNHTPLVHIIGRTEFYGREFRVNKHTLIPRPETELLVENALTQLVKSKLKQPRLLEIGTGSGCIALTLKSEFSKASILASDSSKRALFIAQRNAEQLGLTRRVRFIQDNIFRTKIKGKFNLIISNPPYIPEYEFNELTEEVKREPKTALLGGKDGLRFYRHFAKLFPKILTRNGIALLEIHSYLAKETADLFKKDFVTTIIKDYSGKNRILLISRR